MQPDFFPRLETAEPETLPGIESDTGTATIERPDDGDTLGDGYRVVLYNDDHTPADAVVEQIIKATQCTEPKAEKIMAEAHFKGRAVCFRGAKEKCHQVALVLREIRLQCEVDSD